MAMERLSIVYAKERKDNIHLARNYQTLFTNTLSIESLKGMILKALTYRTDEGFAWYKV